MFNNKILVCLGILCLILGPIRVDRFEPSTQCCDTDFPYVVLNTFPVDLDKLYCKDNSTLRNIVLDLIGNGSYGWPLSPFGAHFNSFHCEGVDHWYVNPYRLLPIYAPHDGFFDLEICELGDETDIVNGTEVIRHCRVVIRIAKGTDFEISHIELNKSIYDVLQATGNYSISEGEIIGFTNRDAHCYGFEIFYHTGYHLDGGGENIFPFIACNESLQNKIVTYYNELLPRARLGGVFPEVAMCNDYYVAVNNTVWGIWEYQSGYLDSYYENNPPPYYEGKYANFFNRNFTSSDYYYRDPLDLNNNISENVVGIFVNWRGTKIDEFNNTDHALVKEAEGNSSHGILESILIPFQSDWGFENESRYVRYSVASNDSSCFKDDILTWECFYDLASAQAGFTAFNLTYKRHLKWWDMDISDDNPSPTNPPPTTPTSTPTSPTAIESWLIAIFIAAVVAGICLVIQLMKKRS